MPSGQAGSVGCVILHEDISKMLERIGIDITFIQYGENKTEANPYEPLSDSAREELQASVDFYGRLFDEGGAKARGISADTVKRKFGQGRVFRPPDAKRVGMVDKIGTMDDVLKQFSPKRARGMAAETPEPQPAAAAVTAAARGEDVVDLNDDGTCPDGYEKGDDDRCYLPAAKAAAAAQRPADKDAIAVTLALTEGL